MAEISLEGMTAESIQGLALLAKGLSEDPKTRTRMLGLVKEIDPGRSIPEIDLPNQFNALLSEERAKREELEAKFRDEDTRRRIREERDAIVAKGVSSKDIPEVEKLMHERGIVNHETAAEFYLSQKKMAVPTPPPGDAYRPMVLPKIDASEYGGDMRKWGKAEMARIWAEHKRAA